MITFLGKNRSVRYLIALALALSALATSPAHAADTTFNCGGSGTYTVTDAGLLTSGQGCTGDLVIDSSVVRIHDYAFYFNPNTITSVTIPDSVLSIGMWAFMGTTAQVINIGAGLSSIDGNAFNSGSIREFIVSVDNSTFSSSSGVLFNKNKTTLIQYPAGKTTTSYTIPSTVTVIGSSSFNGGVYLESVTIPDTVITLGSGAFQQNNALRSVTIGSGITEITGAAFYNNFGAGISEIIFSSSTNLRKIAGSAFVGARWKSLVIPAGVEIIEASAFSGNGSLIDLRLPLSMTTLDPEAFPGTSQLTKVCYLGENSTVIQAISDNGKTVGCVGLPAAPTITSTTTGDSEIRIAFTAGSDNGLAITNYEYSTDGTTYVPFDPTDSTSPVVITGLTNGTSYTARIKAVNALGAGAASASVTATPAIPETFLFACPTGGGSYEVYDGKLKSFNENCGGDLTLDSSVTTIDTYAFYTSTLTSLTIPATVTSILGATFGGYGARSLVSITVAESNPNYSSVDGVLFNKLQTELLVYPGAKLGATYTIPSTVTSTRYYAFAGSRYLTSMNIPNTVTTLGGQTFIDSKLLTTVNIGTGLENIGSQDFAWLPTLTSINVEPANSSFTSIDGVLYNKQISTLLSYPGGKSGTSYVAPSTVTSTATTAFGGVVNLLTADLSSVSTLSSQTFMDAPSIQEVIFGDSLTNLRSQTFQSAPKLRKITFGTGLTSVTDGAFYANDRLYCIIYTGNDSTIQNYLYPNGVVPVTSSANCLANPAIALSNSTISGTVGTPISSYTIASSGGAVARYSISPDISYIPGLSFNTSTGVISGTPLFASSARTFTVTATNAADVATRTFTIVIRPIPVPYLNSITKPKLNLKDGSYMCSAGTYEFGYTFDGVADPSVSGVVTPDKYTYFLLINGVADLTLTATTAKLTHSWSITQPASGSLISCTIAVTVNSLSVGALSTDNTDGVAAAQEAQSKAIRAADATYKAAAKAIPLTYQSRLLSFRATMREQTDAARTNYNLVLDRIKANGGSKMISDTATAVEILAASKRQIADQYAASKSAAYVAADTDTKAAINAKTVATAKAKATYGTHIESIGHGVLIP